MNRCLWPTLPAAYSQGWGSRRIQSKESTKKNKNHKQIKSTPEGVDVCIVHVHMCARAIRIHYTTIAFDTLNNAQRCMCDTNTSWFILNLTNITETYIFLCSCTICSNCLSFGFEPQNQHTYTYTPKHAHNKDKSHKRRKRRQKWYKGSSNQQYTSTNQHPSHRSIWALTLNASLFLDLSPSHLTLSYIYTQYTDTHSVSVLLMAINECKLYSTSSAQSDGVLMVCCIK